MVKTSCGLAGSILLTVISQIGLFAQPASGTVTVITSQETVDLSKPIPLAIANANGVKIAFQTMGSDLQTMFTLHETSLGDMHHWRDAWRYTGTMSLQQGNYLWGGGDWAPCLYRADQFLPQDSYQQTYEGVPRNSSLANFTQLTFMATTNQVRKLVIYRGDDTTPPQAPGQLTVQADASGVHLTWGAAGDDVGVAWYVISRAAQNTTFAKVAQTANLAYTDKPPVAGTYRYRVLAVDYERNVGPWSAEVTVNAAQGFTQPPPTSVITDASYYADHVRAVHDAGAGKVNKGFVFNYGDCINYLDRTQQRNRAMLPLIPYTLFNPISNPNIDLSPVSTSSTLLANLNNPNNKTLSLMPEFCLLTCGLEDLTAKPPAGTQSVVNNVLQMIKKFEAQGTVVVFATTNPYAQTNPIGSPEETLSDALATMCQQNGVPVARVFDLYRNAANNHEDYTKLMQPVDTDTHGGAWPNGFAYAALWPSFEEGLNRRLIVLRETLDRVLFTLSDRPGEAPSSPSPANGAANVATNATLSWSPASGATFDVYLDMSSNPQTKVASALSVAAFAPTLQPGTTYYWKVVATTSGYSTTGPIWSFTTRLVGDINGDGHVNVADLQLLVTAWAATRTPQTGNWSAAADLNGDGYVNVGDLQLLVVNWGRWQ